MKHKQRIARFFGWLMFVAVWSEHCMVAWFPVTVRVFHFLLICHITSNMSSCIGIMTRIRYKGSSLTWYNHCLWRLSSVILHCAVVCPYNVTLIQWWVNGEYCLVGTCSSINYVLGLLVGSIESYHYPILFPGDGGSRSTSGGAGEGPGQFIVSKIRYIGWTCMDKEVKMQLVCEKYMRSVTERLQTNGARIQGYSNVTVHLPT